MTGLLCLGVLSYGCYPFVVFYLLINCQLINGHADQHFQDVVQRLAIGGRVCIVIGHAF